MSNLKSKLIRLGEQRPELRDHLSPILDSLSQKTSRIRPVPESDMDRYERKIPEQKYFLYKREPGSPSWDHPREADTKAEAIGWKRLHEKGDWEIWLYGVGDGESYKWPLRLN